MTFSSRNSSFFNELKRDVDLYFAEQQLQKTGNWKLYLKGAVLALTSISLYISLLNPQLPWLAGVSMALLLGFTLACIGFNVMHDACHGSYSEKKWVNNLLGLTLNALGGNAFIWKFKHNILHHTYTNVDGIDDDIAKSPLIRQCYSQKWVPIHRIQHLYVILVYAISSFAWVFIMDFNKYFTRRVHNTPLQKMGWQEHTIFWISKAMYVLFYILIPVYFVGWGTWAIGFALMHLSMGLTLALVFQLAHVVEDTTFEKVAAQDARVIENEWAIHQVQSTANFAPKNQVISWLVGGLNFQVEHHLFPRISHVHYPAISAIVQQNCTKFNIKYHVYSSLGKAMHSHFSMMRKLGQNP